MSSIASVCGFCVKDKQKKPPGADLMLQPGGFDLILNCQVKCNS